MDTLEFNVLTSDFFDKNVKINNKLVNFNTSNKFSNFLQKNLHGIIKCPITACIFSTPVIASDGFVYEQTALNQFFKYSHQHYSPMTRQIMTKDYFPVKIINQIINYTDKYKIDIGINKYIINESSFEENFDMLCNEMNNSNYDEIFNFKNFLLDHCDIHGISFCEIILKVKFKNQDKYIACLKYIIDNSCNLDFNLKKTNIMHIFFKYCVIADLIKYVANLLFTKYNFNINKFNIKDEFGKTPPEYAFQRLQYIHNVIFDLKFDISSEIITFINVAITKNTDENLAKKLIDSTTLLNFYTETSPLIKAIQCQKINIINYILNKGFDIEFLFTLNKKAIFFACETGNLQIAKIFIDKSTDLEFETEEGWKIIHCVCYYGNKELIEYLLEKDIKLITQIKKFNGKDKNYLPINLIELNERINKKDKNSLIDLLIQLMQFQYD